MSRTARTRLIETWDRAVDQFLRTGDAVPAALEPWFNAYRGSGLGAVDRKALPEPYLGDIMGRPRAAFLALNPGEAFPFQRPGGAFVKHVQELGSYRAWAASWPYLTGAWEQHHSGGKPNRHHASRLKFLRRWFSDERLGPSDMVAFELYPWHSSRITAAMRPDPELIYEFVWSPLAEIGVPAFAFGAPWFPLLEEPRLGLEVVDRLGQGGRPFGSRVASRSVLVLRHQQAGLTVLAEKHSGAAGPPSASEAALLQQAVNDWF